MASAPSRVFQSLVLAVLAFVAPVGPSADLAHAQSNYPAGPVRLIVPFAAGGPTDLIARPFAQRLGEALGTTIVTENVSGAGGTLGSVRAMQSPSDGYTLLLGNLGTHALVGSVFKKPPYDPVEDFQPVSLVARSPSVVVMRNGIPATSVKEFVAYARSQKQPLTFGTAGAGSSSHLSCLMFTSMAGIEGLHVPFRGGSAITPELIAERLDFSCDLPVSARGFIEAKQVKGLVLASDTRLPLIPNVPTGPESGLPDFKTGAWHALFMPKGTPPDIVNKVLTAVRATLDDPVVIKTLAEAGAAMPGVPQRSPEGLRNWIKDEIARLAPIAAKAGIEPQ